MEALNLGTPLIDISPLPQLLAAVLVAVLASIYYQLSGDIRSASEVFE